MPAASGSPRLSDPLTLPCGLTLPNRIVKAAMTEALADADNNPTPRLDRLYGRFAAGRPGLILTGNIMVDRRHLERARNVVADAATDRHALRRYATATGDVPTIVQLSHPGRQTNRMVQSRPLGPSRARAVGMAGLFARPRAMTLDEIADLRRRFVTAGQMVVEAGFDGVQVHAAHGYLLSSFLSPELNQRQDAYGVDLSGRARLLLEIVEDLRATLPTGAAVAVKLNSSDGGTADTLQTANSIDAMVEVTGWLRQAGADFVEVSGGSYESPALLGLDRPEPDDDAAPDREVYFWDAAVRAAQAVDLPVLLTGGFRTRGAMDAALESGAAALIGIGRPLAVDPMLARRLLDGEVDELARPAPRIGGPQPLQKLLGGAANTGWHRYQLERHGDGRSPEHRLPAALAVADYVVRDAAQALLARRRRFATVERVDRSS
jgi:2,4-dienoyl-CoA reductase-like NADH-dependent reductase (Old Yellow Enzyme family)